MAEKIATIAPMENIDAETLRNEFKQFVYGVSHDMNSYARGMIEFAKLIREEEAERLSDEGKLYFSMIIESGEKLQAMLGRLVDYSRLNTMAKPFEMTNCDQTVRQAIISLNEKIKNKNAQIEVAKLPEIKADTDQVFQLFSLLIENSLKFVAPNEAPKIKISVENKNGEWLFQIEDKGIGITPIYAERAFEPFKRLNADTDYPGIGLGLTMARKIVTRHGGKIWSETVPNGCLIKFTFPA